MASRSEAKFITLKADAAIARGKAVKFGSDYKHVAVGAANTDRCYGILNTATTEAEDDAIVCIPGGGALGLLGEAVSAGDDLVSHTDGTLVKPNAEGDQIIARASQGGSAGDLIGVEVYYATAHAAQ